MDPDTKRLMMFAGGLGAVLVVLISASALMERHTGAIPVVTADPRPIREKPANPGGMKIDGAENDVFSGGSDTDGAKLAPAPEAPDTKALRTADAPKPEAVEAPAPVAAAAPSPVTKPAVVASAPPKPTVVASVPPKPAVVASVPPKPAAASKPPVAAVEEAHPAATGHSPMVQLAALASEDAARAEWALMAKKMPELLNGKQPNYSRIDRDGHSFWRVRTSGFADVTQARVFCDHVRAKGAGCSVADF
jgi:hypothetical protein